MGLFFGFVGVEWLGQVGGGEPQPRRAGTN